MPNAARYDPTPVDLWTSAQLALTTNAETTLQAPSSATRRLIVESVTLTNTSGALTRVDLKDGNSGAVIASVAWPATAAVQTITVPLGTHGMKLTIGNNLRAVCSVGVSTVFINATGYEVSV
jgi:hypothetical protein